MDLLGFEKISHRDLSSNGQQTGGALKISKLLYRPKGVLKPRMPLV